MGLVARGWRWLRNRESGPWPRLRRVAGVLRSTVRDRGPWRSLPEALATALLAPVRRSRPPAPPAPPRDWAPERTAAAERLAAAGIRLAGVRPRDLRVAAIADAEDLAVLTAACRVTPIRPEDWALELEAATAAGSGPDVLLVTSARRGNGGAWTYRIGWYAHSDSLLHRDLRALTDWCAEHGIPSVFVAGVEPEVVRDFGDAAASFDLVLARDAATAAAFEALPGRRGAGVAVAPAGPGPRATLAGIAALCADAGAPRHPRPRAGATA